MDYSSAHVFEYISYLLSMAAVFTLKDIPGLSIYLSGGNKERRNDVLNVVDVDIFSWFEKLCHTILI